MFLQLDPPLTNRSFISIVILSFQRVHYLKRCLDSIHEHADLPFEIIVNDDASTQEGTQDTLYEELRPLTSTTIFNTGVNMGFAASANKAIALANSEYVLLLNNDIEMLRPAFRAVCAGLYTPYVGCLGVVGGFQAKPDAKDGVYVHTGTGIDLKLGNLPRGAGMFAFRKSVWQSLGGFPSVYNNNADTAFHHACLRQGYFNATLINQPQLFKNVDEDLGYPEPTSGTTRFDQSYPHIFGVPDDVYKAECLKRRERMYYPSHHSYQQAFGLCNIQSWDRFFKDAEIEDGTYDFEKFIAWGQNKHQDEVKHDVRNWRNLAVSN